MNSPKWTRATYDMVAEILASKRPGLSQKQRDALIVEFAVIFAPDNPNFDASRFEAACQVNN